MNRLHEKLRSQNGASLLLALLMFFFCAMVSASILAVAASNAGKVRSSHVEQQKELVLSSAIQLVCDQLEKASYTGQYNVYEWTEAGENFFYCVQSAGTYSGSKLDDFCPLQAELDAMLGEKFQKTGYKELAATMPEADTYTGHTMIVSLPNGLDGYPYPANPTAPPRIYEISRDVTVKVVLNHTTWHITVTAWLGTDTQPPSGEDTMIAELKAVNVPALNYSPAGRSPWTPPEGGSVPTETPRLEKTATDPKSKLKWELYWIKKGAT